MVVIIINGVSGSGKDTVIEFFEDIAREEKGYKVTSIDSIAKIKEAAKILGWNGEKTPSTRAFFHTMKLLSDDIFDTSTKYVKDELYKARDNGISVAFVHIREAASIADLENRISHNTDIVCLKLLVKGSEDCINMSYGDDSVGSIEYDYIIHNLSTKSKLRIHVVNLFDIILHDYPNYF